ncbi:MAG: triphosphoribosyl-dephospho-CoA synthase [Actinomycetota bacterium]|nr:triphosphoribosyl-dephospho-CoA synthase [Actinomycetota bacterium]
MADHPAQQPGTPPVAETTVAACVVTALTLVYSAPTPGVGSRYADGPVAHESRILSVPPVGEALAAAGREAVGETVLRSSVASNALAGYADPKSVGYLAPLARSALLGRPSERVLRELTHADVGPFLRALEAAGVEGPLAGTLRVAAGAGREATLRDAMRFAAGTDALAREYARDFEVTRELARPAFLGSLSRGDSARAAVVQTYLEVLSETPDLEAARRAGNREAEDVSRMARGVLKAGGVHSRRGIEAIGNLDGVLRSDGRLSPTATEPPVVAAVFLIALEYGPATLAQRLRPASGGARGR